MFYTKKAGSAVSQFISDEKTGLTSAQVARNKEKYGINGFSRSKPITFRQRLASSLAEPMTILLIFAAVLTTGINVAKYFSGRETDFLECVGIFAAIILSTAITLIMEGKSAKAFEALDKMNSGGKLRVQRDGVNIMVPSEEIVCGDIIYLSAGDRVPADARLISCTALTVDEATLTGESMPSEKNAEAVLPKETPLAERVNMLYSGCFVTGGNACAIVVAVGDKTEFGGIAASLSSSAGGSVPIQEKLSGLGKQIAKLGAIAAVAVFIIRIVRLAAISSFSVEAVSEALISSVILLVAAVPEGLPTIAAVSLAINVIRMSKENALVKKMTACETIGSINVICTDKTGTLTENKMTVTSIKDYSENDFVLQNICINKTACSDGKGGYVGNPTECALLLYAALHKDAESIRSESEILSEMPFSSEKKYMETVITTADGSISFIKGSPEKILSLCAMSGTEKEEAERAIGECQDNAGRVIAFAHKVIGEKAACDFIFDGFASISDPLRSEVMQAVSACLEAGIDVKILTGDSANTARSIGRELGIISERGGVFEAWQIEAMTDDELKCRLSEIKIIARSTPETKLRFVNMLKSEKNIVAVTGDGINDAPAIKSANVGIAMGITGTEVSKEAAEVVLLDDSFATIAKAVRMGREIFESFRKFIKFQLTVNTASVLVVLIYAIFGLKSPFTALQLLWVNIIMDGPPALMLGLLPVRENLMKRPPQSTTAGILTTEMKRNIGIKGVFMTAVILLQTFFNFLDTQTSTEQSTVVFTLFVMLQLMNALSCSGNKLFCKENKLLYASVCVTFVLQVLIVTFLGAMFATTPLSAIMWVKILVTSSLILILGISERE